MRAGHIGWAAAVLVIAGCAAPGTAPRDGSEVGVSSSPAPPVSAPATRAPGPEDGPPGDGAPNNADNNAWKQRGELSTAQRRTGQELAARIRPKLEAMRVAGDLTPESTRQALLGFGLPAGDVQVTAMWPAIDTGVSPPGAAYGIHLAGGGCVIGSVRPERVTAEVTAAAAEFGCLEPQTH